MELFGLLIRSKIADRIDVAFAPPKIRKNVLSHRLFVSARSQKYIENIRDLYHFQKTAVSCSAGVSDAPRHQKIIKKGANMSPTLLQKSSKKRMREPMWTTCRKKQPNGSKNGPKGGQKGAKGPQRRPKGSQREPIRSQR